MKIIIFLALFSIAFADHFHGTPNGAGNKDGSNWLNSYDSTQIIDSLITGFIGAGDHLWLKSNNTAAADTITLGKALDFNTNDGTSENMVYIQCVNPGVTAVGTDIDTITMLVRNRDTTLYASDSGVHFIGEYVLQTGDYCRISGICRIGGVDNLFYPMTNSIVTDCDVYFTYSSNGDRDAISASSGVIIEKCHISGIGNGNGIKAASSSCRISFSYIVGFNNSASGCGIILVSGGDHFVMFNTIVDCNKGIRLDAQNRNNIVFNTFYNDSVQTSGTTSAANYTVGNEAYPVLKNVYSWSTAIAANYYRANHTDSTAINIDTTYVYNKDNERITGNPLWTDTLNRIFTHTVGSPCLKSVSGGIGKPR
jgi:hypothetical protein